MFCEKRLDVFEFFFFFEKMQKIFIFCKVGFRWKNLGKTHGSFQTCCMLGFSTKNIMRFWLPEQSQGQILDERWRRLGTEDEYGFPESARSEARTRV
jgi:hypothetical protein